MEKTHKINFGQYTLYFGHYKNFSNGYFNGRIRPTEEFEALCIIISDFLSIPINKQNRGGEIGAGKRVWNKLQDNDIENLKQLAMQYDPSTNTIKKSDMATHVTLAEEISNPEEYAEGATKKISINVYERNTKARNLCIEHYGNSCVICDFNFEKEFGILGQGFIHVHHLKPLAEIGREYNLNPIEDLRPVCPNCHSMLHRKSPALSIKEIMNIRCS